jgi:hypothetical protein
VAVGGAETLGIVVLCNNFRENSSIRSHNKENVAESTGK